MEEDILQEISNDQFEEVCAFLQEDIPSTLVCGWNFIKMHCSEDKVALLQLALTETKKLNWTRFTIFEGLHFKLLPTLESVFQNKNINSVKVVQYQKMFLPLELHELFTQEMVVPEGFVIRPLTSEDATLVDETWAYHGPTTYDYIHHSIVYYGGLGLVSKQSGQLVSWAVGVWNTIGMVYTMPDYRHRGYAEVVIKALAQTFIYNNVQPICLIKSENAPSLHLFKRIVFVAEQAYCIDLLE